MPRKPAKKKKTDFPLLDHVDALMAKLHETLPAALEQFDADAVHQARVSTRRLKAALDLMKPVLSKRHQKPLGDGLKRLRKRLGPLRDADVMIDALIESAKAAKHSAGSARLRRRLEEGRENLRDDARDEASAKKELKRVQGWPLVRHEIVEAREAVDCLLAESLHLQADAFAEQADRLAAAGDAADVDGRPNPHDVRIAGKALRYTLEMADAEGHSPGTGLMRTFKRMQDQLGTWHDYVVLADTALAAIVDAELAHHDASAAEQAIDLAKFAVRRSSQELAGFVKLWRQRGTDLAGRIRSAFPLTRPAAAPVPAPAGEAGAGEAGAGDVIGSGTGPDLAGSGSSPDRAADPSAETPAA